MSMDQYRTQRWEQLLDLLDQADALQQALLGDSHPQACYEFHQQLNNLRDEFEGFAQHEEQNS